jgi:hypothetical protein
MAHLRAALATLLLAGGLVLFAPAGPAEACSCAQLTPEEHVDLASTVFTGTLVERHGSGRQVIYGFEVDEVLKGSATRTIRVRTAGEEASCGLPNLTEGKDYLVLAMPGGDDDDRLFVSLCGGTRGIGGAGDTDRVESVTGPGRTPDAGGPWIDGDDTEGPAVPYWGMAALAGGAVGLLGVVLARRRQTRPIANAAAKPSAAISPE